MGGLRSRHLAVVPHVVPVAGEQALGRVVPPVLGVPRAAPVGVQEILRPNGIRRGLRRLGVCVGSRYIRIEVDSGERKAMPVVGESLG